MSMAQALSDLFGSLTQKQVAERLTSAGCPVDQTKVSRWKRGATEPPVSELLAIERAFNRPPGWLLARAGLVPSPGVEPLTQPGEVDGSPELRRRVSALETGFDDLLQVLLDSVDLQETATATLRQAQQAVRVGRS